MPHRVPWDAYMTTVVTITLPTGHVVVTPTDGAASGRLPAVLGETVHVVTAWNPWSRPLDRTDNKARNALLRGDLEDMGATNVPAMGCSPDGIWCEDSFAVVGRAREAMRSLAATHGQAALFEIRTGELAVVATEEDRVLTTACTIT